MKLINKRLLIDSIIKTLPVMSGYLVLGIGFGILMNDYGFAWYYSSLMAIFIYAGSMQYLAVNLLSTATSLTSIMIMTILVNIRHLFYGLAMLDKYLNTNKLKPYLIFSLTDETFSLVCNIDSDNKKEYFYISILNQTYWIIGCTLGAILGTLISFNTMGVEFSMTALFVVIFLSQWEKKDGRLPAIIGVLSTLGCLLIFGKESFLIPSMILIVILLNICYLIKGGNHG